jgi:hypothetical protein
MDAADILKGKTDSILDAVRKAESPFIKMAEQMMGPSDHLKRMVERELEPWKRVQESLEPYQKLGERCLANFEFELPGPISDDLMRLGDIELGPPLAHYLCGEATFNALKEAVDDLVAQVPQDHDVLVEACGIVVTHIEYKEPHTLRLTGLNRNGNQTHVVIHFTQLSAHVVYLPKQGRTRVITGFSRQSQA